MSESKMEQVAQILGVELEEEFKIKGLSGRYKISDKGLMICLISEGEWKKAASLTLEYLLRGLHEIEKMPFINVKEDEE